MIDKEKVKNFWDLQALKAESLRLEGVANLEEDPSLLDKKIAYEFSKVMSWVNLELTTSKVLDLGSGAGQWSFHFGKIAKQVTAVEYSKEMLNLAIKEAQLNRIDNIEFIYGDAQSYNSNIKFDLIWLSGLLIYMNDEECEDTIKNCSKMLDPNGSLILRDSTGYPNRYEIQNEYSASLNSTYSACYRSVKEYTEVFRKYGFKLLRDQDMFPEGSQLNKWINTRLRLYEFRLIKE